MHNLSKLIKIVESHRQFLDLKLFQSRLFWEFWKRNDLRIGPESYHKTDNLSLLRFTGLTEFGSTRTEKKYVKFAMCSALNGMMDV